MKCYIGLGSNLADRKRNLERAASALSRLTTNHLIRASAVYESPALVPQGAPKEWSMPFLNAVIEMQWEGLPADLLKKLKELEKELGRAEAPRWSPRIIDLDLLLFGQKELHESNLRVPHPEIARRSFVLDPLKDLNPLLRIPGSQEPVLLQARQHSHHVPWIMAILNLTPDSFSDGGEAEDISSIEVKLNHIENSGAQAIDIGAESTRPGARPITQEEEVERLLPALELLAQRRGGSFFRPWLSVDTRHAATADFVLRYGVDCINDVSGLSDPAMLDLLFDSSCDYVLMHSLTVPADPSKTLSQDCDPIVELRHWLQMKLELLDSKGIDLRRVIFDPGIGFGKTAAQSLAIIERIEEFSDLPLRILIGHSRKSFLKNMGAYDRADRDVATLALSMNLARKGVDILRVHDFESHTRAIFADLQVRP